MDLKSLLLGETLPFTLLIDGKALSEVGTVGEIAVSEQDGKTVYSRTVTVDGGLKAVFTAALFHDGSAAEVSGAETAITLVNEGNGKSPVISGIDYLKVKMPRSEKYGVYARGVRRVLYTMGSHAMADDYLPREHALYLEDLVVEQKEARSSSKLMPYFNYVRDPSEGMFFAIGWSGRWKAAFRTCDTVTFTFPSASFSLAAGESVALPTMLLVPWTIVPKDKLMYDDYIPESFNVFRRFMKKHVVPDGIEGGVFLRAWGSVGREGHEARFANMKKFGLHADAYGVDAGWYSLRDKVERDWFKSVGEWTPDPAVYGDSLKWMADGGREAGCDGFWLWFELERAVKDSAAVKEHPEHYFIANNDPLRNMIRMDRKESRDWLRERLGKIIRDTKLTVFRMDFNFDPAFLFDENDAREGCAGLTELRYYNGVYTFFEELKAEYPGIIVDNCASGGRRLDYRMYHVGPPFMCRSDYYCTPEFDPTGAQCLTMGLARWLPVQADACGSCTGSTFIDGDTYRVRSSMACGVSVAAPGKPISDEIGNWYRDILEEAKKVEPYMSLDFYPLTGHSFAKTDWAAWETVSYDGEKAMVMAFRREQSLTASQTFRLFGLNEEKTYNLTDSGDHLLGTATGKDLAAGYEVVLPEPRSSAIVFFTAVEEEKK